MRQYFLRGNQGDKPVRFNLLTGRQILGRDRHCEIWIAGDNAVSRRHAEIEVHEGGILLRDLGSLNGTFVNRVRVKEDVPLHPGDTIRVGRMRLTLSDREPTQFGQLAPEGTVFTLTTSVRRIQDRAKQPRSTDLLTALHEAGQMLSRSMDLKDLYERMLDLLERFIHADRILILPSEILEGNPAPLAARLSGETGTTPLRMSRTILRQILEDGQSFLTTDAATDPKLAATQSLVGSGIHAAMGAPLFDNDRILGAVYVDSRVSGLSYGEEDLHLLTLLANMIAVKITNSRLEEAERRQERIRQEIALAAHIQRNLLPRAIPDVERYEIFTHQVPCYEVGGDLYDVRMLSDGTVWLVLGDVSGKGVGAAMLMAHVMASLQILETECRDPLDLVNRLERGLQDRVDSEQFVTLFAGFLDPGTGQLHYVNAGHNPPIIFCAKHSRSLDPTGLPVAMLPNQTRDVGQCTMEDDSTLLVFSDGVPETADTDGRFYGEGRLQEFLAGAKNLDAATLGRKLVEDVDAFRGDEDPTDDLTLLIARRRRS